MVADLVHTPWCRKLRSNSFWLDLLATAPQQGMTGVAAPLGPPFFTTSPAAASQLAFSPAAASQLGESTTVHEVSQLTPSPAAASQLAFSPDRKSVV